MDTQYPSVQCAAGVFNCGCGRSFHHQGDLTGLLMDSLKLSENILNVPVEEFLINRITSHNILSTAST